nr:ATP-dependent zinc metalloprotease FtsH [Rhodohalobacter barkolensis]
MKSKSNPPNKKSKNKSPDGKSKKEQNKSQRPTGFIYWFYLIAFVVLGYWVLTDGNGMFGTQPEIEYSTFKEQLRSDNVERVHIQGNRIDGIFRTEQKLQLTDSDTTSYKNFITVIPSFGDERLTDLLEENDVIISAEADSDGFWWYFLVFSMPLFFLLLIGWMFYRRMQMQGRGMFNIGKSQAKLQEPGKNKTTFDDIAGMDGAKTELREIIEFLKDPSRFEEIGAKLPKGVLLMGPPGTGKTLLARAVAGEAEVPFYTITGSDFMEMFVGVGAKRVREMFKQAKEKSPAIIFIDEIDSIGRKRGAGLGGGHDEREQTLNQLLSELDGFEPSENVIVMAATNRPDILDKALLRPGRFDRQISVDLPSQNSRLEILKIHARNKSIDESVDLKKIASSTPGFSGADLENLLNEASLYAGRNKRKKIIMDDIENARDKIMMGLEREGMQIDDEEKRILAYHEAGHAIVAAALPNSDPLHKVSVIPRGKAMGITMQLPEKEKYLYNKEYLLDRMAVIMGGRAAEQLIFNTATSGAQNDLMQVAKLSRKMVVEWGMSEKFGHLAFGGDEEDVFLGRDMTRQKSYSDSTAREIDQEVQVISQEAYDRALKILKENKEAFDKLAELLIEKEEVSGEEVLSLMKDDSE